MKQKRKLVQKTFPFTLQVRVIYQQGHDQVLRCYLHLEEILVIIKEMHNSVGGGHFLVDITNRKIMDAKHWCPTLHKDV